MDNGDKVITAALILGAACLFFGLKVSDLAGELHTVNRRTSGVDRLLGGGA